MEIYYVRSSDNGQSWENETRLTVDGAVSGNPSLYASGASVHVAWQDNRNANNEIYYKRSTDGGLNWLPDTRLTFSPDSSNYPSIFAAGSNVHIVWQDFRDGNWEVYYKGSTDGGLSWGTDTRITNNPSISQNPSVAISGTAVYVVWSDNRDGNYEIYFQRNPTGNPLGIKNINSEIPSSFSLSQNYPNPFNPATHIRFEIAELSLVKMSIFDSRGSDIATLVSQQLQPGAYEVDWDCSDYSSGVYYYRLSAGEYNETKKMILIR
jgi:hypothetical protein